jgi:hypothetical protein
VLLSFGLMVLKAEGLPLTGAEQALKDPRSRAEFRRLARERGLRR